MTEVENIFRIPSSNMGELQEKLKKLNKKADKLGTGSITLTILSTETVEEKIPGWTLENGEVMEWRTVARDWNTLQIDGETPMLNGWQFIATLIHGENGTMINRVPTFASEVDLSQYRDADPSHCDHCGLDRRRVDTFVVYNAETGETKQIGRQCLKDFLGYNDPMAVARQLERIKEFMVDMREGNYTQHSPDMELTTEYLTHVAAMIRLHGWVSRAMADADYSGMTRATSIEAYYNMVNYGQTDKNGKPIYEKVIDEDAEVAKVAFEWNELHWSKDSNNEFEGNMAVAYASEWFNTRTKGFVAYGVQAYLKDQTEQIEKAAKAEQAPSEWQGEVGKRQVFEGLTVAAERVLEDDWQERTTWLYTLVDDQGNDFKWFASNPKLKVGQTYNLKATVKKHDEYKGTKQTVITRATEV